MLAPLWNDLCNWDYQQFGEVFYWHDEYMERFLIEWSNFRVAHAQPHQSLHFQVILYDPLRYPTLTGDSEIVFHYHSFHNQNSQENYATIGIEDPTELIGLEYSFNNEFYLPNQLLTSQQSLKFTTGPFPEAVATSVAEHNLLLGYPNPFNSRFTLHLTQPRSGPVRVEIYNLLGEQVVLLQDGILRAGIHQLYWDATAYPSGLYFYRVSGVTEQMLQGKCLLLR